MLMLRMSFMAKGCSMGSRSNEGGVLYVRRYFMAEGYPLGQLFICPQLYREEYRRTPRAEL